jgi:hypothetical protein
VAKKSLAISVVVVFEGPNICIGSKFSIAKQAQNFLGLED